MLQNVGQKTDQGYLANKVAKKDLFPYGGSMWSHEAILSVILKSKRKTLLTSS